nr:MAG TPA: hypothetical protein [Caudoviricetes sp.]
MRTNVLIVLCNILSYNYIIGNLYQNIFICEVYDVG